MSTDTNAGPSKLQNEMETTADALANTNLTLLSSLVVLGSNLSKAEVIAKLRAYLALYTAVLQAKQAYGAAVVARQAIEATARAEHASIVGYIKLIIGPNDPGLLATFGIAAAKPRRAAKTKTTAVAQAKAVTTRTARGTMSKKQRLAISATPAPSVQVVGLPTPTVAPPAPAPGSATPS